MTDTNKPSKSKRNRDNRKRRENQTDASPQHNDQQPAKELQSGQKNDNAATQAKAGPATSNKVDPDWRPEMCLLPRHEDGTLLTTEELELRVPELQIPPGDPPFDVWPSDENERLVSIHKIGVTVHNLRQFLEDNKDNPGWKYLDSHVWFPLLKSTYLFAQDSAERERSAMERDMVWYRYIFPNKQAGELIWPMGKAGHVLRTELNDLLVE